MALEPKLVESFVIERAEFRCQASKCPDEPELRGDAIDDENEPDVSQSTGHNRNPIIVHVKKLAEQQYLQQVGQGRGALHDQIGSTNCRGLGRHPQVESDLL